MTLLEKGELTSGTTGRHHGQLHCGARYAWSDKSIARECYAESLVLSRIAGGCIEYNGGFFIALGDGEKAMEREFVERCVDAGIPAAPIGVDRLRRLEPALSEKIVAAVAVPDGSFDRLQDGHDVFHRGPAARSRDTSLARGDGLRYRWRKAARRYRKRPVPFPPQGSFHSDGLRD